MTGTYTFKLSAELVNRIEEARQHHKAKYGDMGINLTFELFFSHIIRLYVDDDYAFVDDALVDLCVSYGFDFVGSNDVDGGVDDGFNDF